MMILVRRRSSILSLSIILGCWGLSPGFSQIQPDGVFDETRSDAVFRPADRELRQTLRRAERAIVDGQYSDAISSLGKLLSEGATEDAFVPAADNPSERTSLKAEAERMLATLPQKGRELYELNFGSEAKALLAEGVKQRSTNLLTEVTRRFFLTKAGQEASILLGRLHLDQGRPLSAALMFRRVMDVPSSKATYDPELSLLLATAWSFAQRPEEARSTLVTLAATRDSVQMDGKALPLFRNTEDPLAWLTNLVGTAAAPRSHRLHQWCVFGGDESRNASISAGMPLADLRWKALTAKDQRDEQEIRQITRRLGDKGEAPLPALQPLAVDDTVLMRTTERLVAIDAITGKIVWEFPWFESQEEASARTTSNNVRNVEAQRQAELEQRLFQDSAYGQVSSDGEGVFLVHDLRPVAPPNVRRVIILGGRPAINPNFPSTYNQLVALDLKKQGKLKFVVGDTTGEDEPDLANVFFLGAPLPHQGELLSLIEKQGEIRLVALNAKTGQMQWSQQLAQMNELTIDVDPIRRLAGVSPSFSDGLVICPTAGGAVVAVDWARRSLSWGYSYVRDAAPEVSARQLMINRASTSSNITPAWPVSAAIIAEGYVVLTPPDSNSLHCLDLVTGKPAWAPLPRKDALEGALYVACVHQGEIVLVCKDGLKNVNLKTGQISNLAQTDFNKAFPSGRGIYSDPFYYLPLASSELLKLNLNDGTVVERLQTDRPLGNLVIHDVDLVSLSADSLSTYYLREPLKMRIEERLSADPQDSWALARKGEILVQEGKTDEALTILREAHRLLPKDEGIRNTLVKLLLAALRQDYAKHAGLTGEIEKLIDQPSERAEFLRVVAPQLDKAGETLAAFDAYLSLAAIVLKSNTSSSPEDLFEEPERLWRVRTDRWLATQLANLYGNAPGLAKETLNSRIDQRLSETTDKATADGLRRLLRFYPELQQERLALAAETIAQGNLLTAEYDLAPLTKESDPQIAGPANALFAKLLIAAKRPTEAILVYEKLGRDFADVRCEGEKTGAQLWTAAQQIPLLQKEVAQQPFSGSRVESQVDPEKASRFRSYQRLMPISFTSVEGMDIGGQTITFDQSRATIIAGDSYGRPVSETLLSQDGTTNRFYFGLMSASSYGHLTALAMGTEVIAIDTLRGTDNVTQVARNGDAILWRHDTVERAANSPYVGYGMQSRQIRNPLAGPSQLYTDQAGKPMGAKVVLGPGGCAFMRSRQLVCVDLQTGNTVWERSGLESGSDLFGDGERLFVVPHGSTEAEVFQAWDGAPLGKRKVVKYDQRWATCGGNVLACQETGKGISLELTDVWNEKVLWKHEFSVTSKGCQHAPDEIAVMEQETGEVVIVSLRDGKVLLTKKLQPEPSLTSLIVQRSADRYLVLPGHPSQEPASGTTYHPAPQGINTVLTSGWVYAFDRISGASLWPAPAYVQQQGYVVHQAVDLPVLLFLRHSTPARSSGAKTVTTVLGLDKRTGAVVLEDDFPAPIHAYEVSADPVASEVNVSIYSQSQRSYTLSFKETPAPPQPPVQQGPFSSWTAGGKAGSAVNVAEAVFDALNNAFTPQPPAKKFGPNP